MKSIATLLLTLTFCAESARAITLKDELPALEPTHVRGLYAGRTVCPMCAHGYDAGIMVFVPASTSLEKLRTLANNISPATLGISSGRFRVFVIVTGEPSESQIEALANDDPRWFVATLAGSALKKTERDLEHAFSRGTSAYVFAKRRLVHLFSDDALYGTNADDIQAQSRFAMQILATRIVGLPCEGCENVFVGMPNTVSSRVRLASSEEPGERLLLEGRVLGANGRPVGGVIVYAYQTNRAGRYPANASGVLGLRGWSQSDAEGRYRFDTIRPGGYPGRPDPAHIHMHVIEPGRCTYYIDDVQFTDDPRVKAQKLESREDARTGSGLVTPTKDNEGVWRVTRDIYLGRNIPGYAQCDAAVTASNRM